MFQFLTFPASDKAICLRASFEMPRGWSFLYFFFVALQKSASRNKSLPVHAEEEYGFQSH